LEKVLDISIHLHQTLPACVDLDRLSLELEDRMIPGTDLDAPAQAGAPAWRVPSAPPAVAAPDPPQRGLAARLLESEILRLARAAGLLESRLGPGLVLMVSGRLYRRLGYVRLADYLSERLGMSLRRCQAIARLSRAVRDLPLVASAFASGALSPSKLRVVASAATPETQDLWLGRARRLSVRQLEELARAGASGKAPDVPDLTDAPGKTYIPDAGDPPRAGRSLR
jgi:hypothetical protein